MSEPNSNSDNDSKNLSVSTKGSVRRELKTSHPPEIQLKAAALAERVPQPISRTNIIQIAVQCFQDEKDGEKVTQIIEHLIDNSSLCDDAKLILDQIVESELFTSLLHYLTQNATKVKTFCLNHLCC